MARVRLRGRALHPYWRVRLQSFGERSVLQRPVRLRGAPEMAVGRDCVLLRPELVVWPRASARREPAIRIGDRVVLRPFTAIAAAESVVIENDVTVAGLSLVTDGIHDFGGPIAEVGGRPPEKVGPVRIGSGTAIGERVAVLPGSNIGSHCHVRANSVVQGRIPDHSLVAGFPARVVGDVRDREHGGDPPGERRLASL